MSADRTPPPAEQPAAGPGMPPFPGLDSDNPLVRAVAEEDWYGDPAASPGFHGRLNTTGDRIRTRAACCDLHNQHCEPPSELCCHDCTEARHPQHPEGATCVLLLDRPAGYRPTNEWSERDWENVQQWGYCGLCEMPRHVVTTCGVVTTRAPEGARRELVCSNSECPQSEAS
ncbi:hypothetical protein [Frankia sp. AgB32]|uniref:hypothetical protein n=1 Tax=Frankia sp. AgB32 TaxID=631119 RepID=UPI00200DDCDD|nr:hypothetical protein [Frankia sp. AgB32]MCK9898137.1 hypothetical protein [Frankia sp. AgB32]